MRQDLWRVTFCMLLAGPVLYWFALVFFACRGCGRFLPTRRGLCYTCWRRLRG